MKTKQQIIVHDGPFYRFSHNGRTYTTAEMPDMREEKLRTALIMVIEGKYGFTLAPSQLETWHLYDSRRERDRAAIEYDDKVCKPLNKAFKEEVEA